MEPGAGRPGAGAGEEVQPLGARQVRRRRRVRLYVPAAERPGLPHRVLLGGVPGQRDGGEDGVGAAGVVDGGRARHAELERRGLQVGRRGAVQVGHEDGRGAAAVLRGDEDAAAGHAEAAGVDAPADPAVGARARAERDVGGAVLRVVRPVQAGAERGHAVAPPEGPAAAERRGQAVLRRRGGREEQHGGGGEEEPRRVARPRHGWSERWSTWRARLASLCAVMMMMTLEVPMQREAKA